MKWANWQQLMKLWLNNAVSAAVWSSTESVVLMKTTACILLGDDTRLALSQTVSIINQYRKLNGLRNTKQRFTLKFNPSTIVISRKICLFFLQNSFLAILMLISRKLVQRRGTGEKCGFFATRRPSTKGLWSRLGNWVNWILGSLYNQRELSRCPALLY